MKYNTNRYFCQMSDLKDLLKDYEVVVVDITAQRGYVSRRATLRKKCDDRPVYAAGGSRKGQLYYLSPRYDTTRYCWRCYLNVTVDDIK